MLAHRRVPLLLLPLRLAAPALAIVFLLVPSNTHHVAVSPDANRNSTDFTAPWRGNDTSGYPTVECLPSNLEHSCDLCCGVTSHGTYLYHISLALSNSSCENSLRKEMRRLQPGRKRIFVGFSQNTTFGIHAAGRRFPCGDNQRVG